MDLVPPEDDHYIAEADMALEHFWAKGHDARMQLSELVHQNCMEFLNAIGYDEMDKPMWDIQDSKEIWQFVHPQEIRLSRRRRRDKDLYLSIECECDWEQEHGLQLVFRQGKQITRVSAQDGWLTEADAFGKSDSEDELLSSFRE